MIKKILSRLRRLNLFYTLYVNFKSFPLGTALRFPILFYGSIDAKNVGKGSIILHVPIKAGMVQVGYPCLGFLEKRTRTIWNIEGSLEFTGSKATFHRGCCIEVGKNAKFLVGDNCQVTGKSTFLCTKEIEVGDNCLFSWEVLVMDTDWHDVISVNDGAVLNAPKKIKIGNHVWVGCRSTILKGITLSDDIIIAANSTVSKDCLQSRVAFDGKKVIKANVAWRG